MAVYITESLFFENLILATILANSLSLASFNYKDRAANTEYNKGLETAGTVFSVFFMVECLLKIVSMGFITHSKSYLRDGWNVLDFIVVDYWLHRVRWGKCESKGFKDSESFEAVKIDKRSPKYEAPGPSPLALSS